MSINEQDILKLANLAKLDFDVTDLPLKTQLTNDLNNIIKLVDQLNELEITDIKPMFHFDDQAFQPLREDLITETDPPTDFQHIAPPNSIESGLYLVPKVIEN